MNESENYIAGRRATLELLRDDASRARIEKVYLAHGVHGPQMSEIIHLLRTNKIAFSEMDRNKFRELEQRIAPSTSRERGVGQADSQGIIVLVAQRDYQELEDVLTGNHNPLLVALDDIEDPHNIGAIIRSAEASGATAILLPKRGTALTPAVYKASAGAANHLPIVKYGNLAETIRKLQEKFGVVCVGLAGEARESIYDTDLTVPVCLVIGSEEKGLHRLVRERCEKLTAIQMFGKTASLNASVACGVALFEALRQRNSRAASTRAKAAN